MYWLISRTFGVDFEPMPFDSATWRASTASHSPDSERLRMADDLLLSCQLHGRSRDQVVALLGPADEVHYFKEYDLVYRLGPERSWIRIDSEWLLVKLDDHGVVSEATLGRD
jgi:hypothetical protein